MDSFLFHFESTFMTEDGRLSISWNHAVACATVAPRLANASRSPSQRCVEQTCPPLPVHNCQALSTRPFDSQLSILGEAQLRLERRIHDTRRRRGALVVRSKLAQGARGAARREADTRSVPGCVQKAGKTAFRIPRQSQAPWERAGSKALPTR